MGNVQGFWLTRLVFQRGLGLVYLIAFLVALNQFRPLLGQRGLLPATDFIRQVRFLDSPSLFYFYPKDMSFTVAAWLGVLLSGFAVSGLSECGGLGLSMTVWGAMYVLYLSFVNVGQIFYGFGWESLLLEAGFYAIFLGSKNVAPPTVVIWMLRWLLFRVMFGAGLIKLRGDPCWRNLTCLDQYYETQPMPNALSWYFHWAPEWTHRAGVGFNHVAELIAPFGYFVSGLVSGISGIVTLIFQSLIMLSGNLSWLNFLTIVLALPTLDDSWLRLVIPLRTPALAPAAVVFQAATTVLALVVAFLSINPVRNMLSPGQVMNTSYNPLHLVGSYGAFGSVTRTRYEVVIEGTEQTNITPETQWREYEFKGKPGDVARRPPQVAPYHLRIDWLMWFAAMSGYEQHPWFVHLVAKLLEGDAAMLGLLKKNPFPGVPPQFIRAELYEYHFTSPEERRTTGQWWKRTLAGSYFPPVSLSTPGFQRAMAQMGWS